MDHHKTIQFSLSEMHMIKIQFFQLEDAITKDGEQSIGNNFKQLLNSASSSEKMRSGN